MAAGKTRPQRQSWRGLFEETGASTSLVGDGICSVRPAIEPSPNPWAAVRTFPPGSSPRPPNEKRIYCAPAPPRRRSRRSAPVPRQILEGSSLPPPPPNDRRLHIDMFDTCGGQEIDHPHYSKELKATPAECFAAPGNSLPRS